MIYFRKLLKTQGQMLLSTYGFETFWSFHPPFLPDFETFWSLDPCRVRRVSHTTTRRRYAPLTRRSICLRLDMALKRSICPAGREEKSAIDPRCHRQHIDCSQREQISSLSVAKTYRVAKQHIDKTERIFIK